MDEHRQLEIQRFIDGLQDSELRLLHVQLGERYRLIRRAQEMQALREFRLMDRVFFHHASEHITGTVIRINQRTLSVLTDTGRRWTVAPEFLHHEEVSSPPNSDDPDPTRVHVVNVTPSPSPPAAKRPSGKSKHKKRKKRR